MAAVVETDADEFVHARDWRQEVHIRLGYDAPTLGDYSRNHYAIFSGGFPQNRAGLGIGRASRTRDARASGLSFARFRFFFRPPPLSFSLLLPACGVSPSRGMARSKHGHLPYQGAHRGWNEARETRRCVARFVSRGRISFRGATLVLFPSLIIANCAISYQCGSSDNGLALASNIAADFLVAKHGALPCLIVNCILARTFYGSYFTAIHVFTEVRLRNENVLCARDVKHDVQHDLLYLPERFRSLSN